MNESAFYCRLRAASPLLENPPRERDMRGTKPRAALLAPRCSCSSIILYLFLGELVCGAILLLEWTALCLALRSKTVSGFGES